MCKNLSRYDGECTVSQLRQSLLGVNGGVVTTLKQLRPSKNTFEKCGATNSSQSTDATVSASLSTPGAFGAWYTKRHILYNLNDVHGDFRQILFKHFRELLESNDEAYVCRLMDYVRLILSMYMFVRVERPRGSKHFVLGYVKCDWAFSFALRFEQMRLRLNCIPPVVLTKVEVEENKALRLTCVGETDYERALAKHSDTRIFGGVTLTPLSAAIYGEDEESAMVLLNGGADPNEVDEDGMNALHWAAQRGCRPPLLQRVLAMIDNVNAGQNYVTTGIHRCRTALIWAAAWNHLDMVVSLMNHQGIDVNVQDSSNYTALHYAVHNNSPAIVAQLVSDDRVDTSLKCNNWGTPLKYAICKGLHECVKILREHGVEE